MTGDIVISNGDQIAQALQSVLDKLAITGSQFWDIYVGYTKLNAMLSIYGILFLVTSAFVVAWLFYWASSNQDKIENAAWGFVCWLVIGGFITFIAERMLVRLYCPEYFAIQNIITQVNGLI